MAVEPPSGWWILGQVLQHSDSAEGRAQPNPLPDPLQCDRSVCVGVHHAGMAGSRQNRSPRQPVKRIQGSIKVGK